MELTQLQISEILSNYTSSSEDFITISVRWYMEVKFIIIIVQNFNYNFKIYNYKFYFFNYKFSGFSIILILSYLVLP